MQEKKRSYKRQQVSWWWKSLMAQTIWTLTRLCFRTPEDRVRHWVPCRKGDTTNVQRVPEFDAWWCPMCESIYCGPIVRTCGTLDPCPVCERLRGAKR